MPIRRHEKPRELTDGEIDLLVDEAVERIELVDGVEQLDGWPLPPDDEGVWQPRTLMGNITTYYVDSVTNQPTARQDVHIFESTLTNREVRRVNIRTLAQGQLPLFITWEQYYKLQSERRAELQQKLDSSWKGKLAEFFGFKLQV